MRWGRGDGRHGVHRSPASLLSFFLSGFIPYDVPYDVPYESQLPFETLSCLISLSTFHQSVSTNVPSSLMSPCVLPAHNPRHCQSRQRGHATTLFSPPSCQFTPAALGKYILRTTVLPMEGKYPLPHLPEMRGRASYFRCATLPSDRAFVFGAYNSSGDLAPLGQ